MCSVSFNVDHSLLCKPLEEGRREWECAHDRPVTPDLSVSAAQARSSQGNQRRVTAATLIAPNHELRAVCWVYLAPASTKWLECTCLHILTLTSMAWEFCRNKAVTRSFSGDYQPFLSKMDYQSIWRNWVKSCALPGCTTLENGGRLWFLGKLLSGLVWAGDRLTFYQ